MIGNFYLAFLGQSTRGFPGFSRKGATVIANYLRTLRLISRDARLCLIAQASLGFSFFGIYAVLLNLYLLRLGYDLKFIGLVNATGQLSFAIASLMAGLIGRRWGNRHMMILGLSLNLVGFGLLPLIKFNQPALESIWLTVTYAISWIGLALLIVNQIPYLMDVTNSTERNHVFSLIGAILPLSAFIGSMMAGILPVFFVATLNVSLDQPAPYRYPLLVSAIIFIPGILALSATNEMEAESQQEPEGRAGLKRVNSAPIALIALLALVMLLMRMGEGATRTFFNVYLDADLQISTTLIAVLSAAGQLLAVPAALTAPLLIARLGLGRTIVWGNLGMACSLLLLAFIPHWETAGLGFVGVMVLVSIAVPAFGVYHQEIMPPRWRTAMSGASMVALGLSWSIITLGGGYIITYLSYRSFFLTSAGLTAVGGLLLWAHLRMSHRKTGS